MRVFIAGVPGVGKSSILDAAGLPSTSFGSLMLAAARHRGYKGTRDALRTLPVEEQAALREEVVQTLPHELVLDGHIITTHAAAFVDAVPASLRLPGCWDRILLLEARPEEIMRRRATRPDRNDATVDVAAYQAHQREAAHRLAAATGAQLLVVYTTGRAIEDVGQEVRRLVSSQRA